jgi:hypothetical protein
MAVYGMLRHGPKRYLDAPEIVLNVTQLLGTDSQEIISLASVPMIMDDIQDLQNGQMSIWTMPRHAAQSEYDHVAARNQEALQHFTRVRKA